MCTLRSFHSLAFQLFRLLDMQLAPKVTIVWMWRQWHTPRMAEIGKWSNSWNKFLQVSGVLQHNCICWNMLPSFISFHLIVPFFFIITISWVFIRNGENQKENSWVFRSFSGQRDISPDLKVPYPLRWTIEASIQPSESSRRWLCYLNSEHSVRLNRFR